MSLYKATPYMYMTIPEAVYMGRSMLPRYAVFRFFPPLAAFVLVAGVGSKHGLESQIFAGLLISATVSVFLRLVHRGNKKSRTMREILFQVAVVLLIYVEAALVGVAAQYVNLSVLIPSRAGLIDSIWSALFITIFVALYISLLTVRGSKDPLEDRERESRNAFIDQCYLDCERQFGSTIRYFSMKSECSLALLFALITYEDINRPAIFRRLENLLVRIPGVSMTVGVAQVRSERPLSDSKSIECASQMLANTAFATSAEDLMADSGSKARLESYNRDPRYIKQVLEIAEYIGDKDELWHQGEPACCDDSAPSDHGFMRNVLDWFLNAWWRKLE